MKKREIILIIDTTSDELFLSLIENAKEHRIHLTDCNSGHSKIMVEEIDKLLRANNISINEVTTFALSVGPGSFTGIRIGVATVKAFIMVSGANVIAVNSLEANAYNYVNEDGKVISIIDAKHDNAYVGEYQMIDGVMAEISHGFMNKAKLEEMISDDVRLVSPYANSFGAKVTENYYDGFRNLVLHKLINKEFATDSFSPLYMKKSQAEEEEDVNKKLGK